MKWTKLFRRKLSIPHHELIAKLERIKRTDVVTLLLTREPQLRTADRRPNDPRYIRVLKAAERRYRESPDWVTFFREVLGVGGIVRNSFPNLDELSTFEQSEEFTRIQKLLVKLRQNRPSSDVDNEPTRVITVRIPKSMHESLRTEAHDLRTSMNKLCISKLLQVIREDMIPNEHIGEVASSNDATFSRLCDIGPSSQDLLAESRIEKVKK